MFEAYASAAAIVVLIIVFDRIAKSGNPPR
jgi:ABC-type proline/glycine betaine transport system permease subunit